MAWKYDFKQCSLVGGLAFSAITRSMPFSLYTLFAQVMQKAASLTEITFFHSTAINSIYTCSCKLLQEYKTGKVLQYHSAKLIQ